MEALDCRIVCSAGDLDLSFGSGGQIMANIGGFAGAVNAATDVAVDAQGRIVVVGNANFGPDQSYQAFVGRYLPNGTLDTTFGGGDGVFALPENENLAAVRIADDGGIVAAGYRWKSAGVVVAPNGDVSMGVDGNDFAVYRFTDDGAFDTGFGDGGVTVLNNGKFEQFASMAIQDDGKIVAVGYTGANNIIDGSEIAVARFTAGGALDTTFGGGDGLSIQSFTSRPQIGNDVVIQPDGKLVVSGFMMPNTLKPFEQLVTEAELMRLNADGSVDHQFGTAGFIHTRIPDDNGRSRFYSVTLDSQARILAGGEGGGAIVARYDTNGTLDTSFGTAGFARNTDGSDASDIAVDADGNIIAAAGEAGYFRVLRFTPNGQVDTTFGDSGHGQAFDNINTNEFEKRAWHLELQDDGKIVTVGTMSYGTYALIARFQGGVGPAAAPVMPPAKQAPSDPTLTPIAPTAQKFSDVRPIGMANEESKPAFRAWANDLLAPVVDDKAELFAGLI